MTSPLNLLRRHGKRDYLGEKGVTQVSHMLQAAELAAKDGSDDYMILAALFHDVGHLLVFERETTEKDDLMGGYGLKNHEEEGAAYLADFGFPPQVCEPVRLHVDAKRYLCTVDPSYYTGLSKASQVTMAYQGGFMGEEEVRAFEANPFFREAIALRRWDDAAKVPDDEIRLETTLDDYECLLPQ